MCAGYLMIYLDMMLDSKEEVCDLGLLGLEKVPLYRVGKGHLALRIDDFGVAKRAGAPLLLRGLNDVIPGTHSVPTSFAGGRASIAFPEIDYIV